MLTSQLGTFCRTEQGSGMQGQFASLSPGQSLGAPQSIVRARLRLAFQLVREFGQLANTSSRQVRKHFRPATRSGTVSVGLRRQTILADRCDGNPECACSLLMSNPLAQTVDGLSEFHVCSTLDGLYAVGYIILSRVE